MPLSVKLELVYRNITQFSTKKQICKSLWWCKTIWPNSWTVRYL